MVNFDFINSINRKSGLFKKNFNHTFIALSIVCVGIFTVSLLLFFQDDVKLVGFGQIFIGLGLLILSSIIVARFATPKVKGDNLVDRFSSDLIQLSEKVLSEASNEGITEIDSEYFFEKANFSFEGTIIFLKLGMPLAQTTISKVKVDMPTFSNTFIQVIEKVASKSPVIEIEDVLFEIANSSQVIQQYLADLKINKEDFEIVVKWVSRMKKDSVKPRFWEKSFITAGIAQEWSFGYTPILSQYSRDLSAYFEDTYLTIDTFGHTNKIDEIQAILSKPSKNNCLLVGEPGVGKKSIVNALAARIANGNSLAPLKYKRIRQIDVARLIGGGTANEIVSRINDIFIEAINAGNIILYIDNFESLIGNGESSQEVGGIDASQVLLPFFENSGLRIIASITPENYFSRIRNNMAMAGVFEKIDVEPASVADTASIMLESVTYIEDRYNVFFDYQAIKSIITLSDRYIHDKPFPEKAINLMEEIAVSLGGKGKLVYIGQAEIESFISKKINVPIGQAGEAEKEKLLNLENLLHSRVIGQNEAISAVSDALRRVRAGLTTGKRPVGVFLFMGPTGVGKTETAKALAESYFGSEKNMIRLDMSEYQQANSVDRLLGSESNPSGILTDQIVANPFSLVLLDEIEKADKNILNVFLQVFEDGRLTDAKGRVADFTNCIVIATTNAGSEFIRQNVANLNAGQLKENLINMIQEQGIFTPEFLNRFDATIVYRPLNIVELQKVANLMIADINRNLVDKKITVTVDVEALTKLVELGNDPQFGARPMRRVIQEKVENLLAKKMLEGVVAEGQTLNITMADVI